MGISGKMLPAREASASSSAARMRAWAAHTSSLALLALVAALALLAPAPAMARARGRPGALAGTWRGVEHQRGRDMLTPRGHEPSHLAAAHARGTKQSIQGAVQKAALLPHPHLPRCHSATQPLSHQQPPQI